jgi:hypothetical protein
MIRDTRTYIATQIVGVLASLMLLIIWSVSPPSHPLFPVWFLIAIAVFMLGSFIYNIYMRLSGRPVRRAWWAQNLTDRQLWTIKAVLIAGLVVIALLIIFHR